MAEWDMTGRLNLELVLIEYMCDDDAYQNFCVPWSRQSRVPSVWNSMQ